MWQLLSNVANTNVANLKILLFFNEIRHNLTAYEMSAEGDNVYGEPHQMCRKGLRKSDGLTSLPPNQLIPQSPRFPSNNLSFQTQNKLNINKTHRHKKFVKFLEISTKNRSVFIE
jgi:hypothetical protein